MVTGAGEMAVISAAFLLAVGRAFARIHVEYDGLRPPPAAHFVDPLTRQIGQRSEVLGPAQPSRLEAAHLAGRGGRPADCPVADHPTHCRVMAQPISIVYVFVPGQTPESRWAWKARQPVATVLAGACVG